MNRMFKWISTVCVMAMSLFLWSCDDIGNTTGPELSPAPMVVMSTSGIAYAVAAEPNPSAGTVSGTIGKSGGKLVLGKHELLVSAGAVSKPTRFTMTRTIEEPLRIKLTAGVESENDVGAVGFAAPVTLSISFQDAVGLPSDHSALTGIYFRPDGLVDTFGASVRGHRASFELPHFSLFGLGWP